MCNDWSESTALLATENIIVQQGTIPVQSLGLRGVRKLVQIHEGNEKTLSKSIPSFSSRFYFPVSQCGLEPAVCSITMTDTLGRSGWLQVNSDPSWRFLIVPKWNLSRTLRYNYNRRFLLLTSSSLSLVPEVKHKAEETMKSDWTIRKCSVQAGRQVRD